MRVFANDIKNITEKDMKLLRRYFRGYEYNGAGYTFIAHYIWKDSYCVSWEMIHGYLCLAGTKCGKEDGEAFMIMPLIMRPEDKAELVNLYSDEDADGKGAGGEGADDKVTGGKDAVDTEIDYTQIRTEYDPKSLRETVLECEKRFADANKPLCFSSIPGHMLDILREAFPGEGEIEFTHDRDYDEYVYLKEKLIDLSGRALHKKKNHLNYFLRNFEYESKPIRQVDREDILRLAAEIRDYKAQDEDEEEDIENEYMAIREILNLLSGSDDSADAGVKPCGSSDADECPICGVGVYINGKLEAFAIGEILSDTMASEQFEKANDEFRGLYQLVCREYCKELPESIIYVNREEDMGLPGLRQAKEALKPEHMEERYTADIKF